MSNYRIETDEARRWAGLFDGDELLLQLVVTDACRFDAESLAELLRGGPRRFAQLQAERDAATALAEKGAELCKQLEGERDEWKERADDMSTAANCAIDALVREGHTDHCAKRLAYGDGSCECGHGLEDAREYNRLMGRFTGLSATVREVVGEMRDEATYKESSYEMDGERILQMADRLEEAVGGGGTTAAEVELDNDNASNNPAPAPDEEDDDCNGIYKRNAEEAAKVARRKLGLGDNDCDGSDDDCIGENISITADHVRQAAEAMKPHLAENVRAEYIEGQRALQVLVADIGQRVEVVKLETSELAERMDRLERAAEWGHGWNLDNAPTDPPTTNRTCGTCGSWRGYNSVSYGHAWWCEVREIQTRRDETCGDWHQRDPEKTCRTCGEASPHSVGLVNCERNDDTFKENDTCYRWRPRQPEPEKTCGTRGDGGDAGPGGGGMTQR
jgi:hypothetical protein